MPRTRRARAPRCARPGCPVFDKHHVDLVLQGHDHAYLRTYPLRDGRRVADRRPTGRPTSSRSRATKYYDQRPRDETAVGFTDLSTYQTIDIEVPGEPPDLPRLGRRGPRGRPPRRSRSRRRVALRRSALRSPERPRSRDPDRRARPAALLDDHPAVEQAEPDDPGEDEPAAPVDGDGGRRCGGSDRGMGRLLRGGAGPTSGGRRGRRGRGRGRSCTGGRPAGRPCGGRGGRGRRAAGPATAATRAATGRGRFVPLKRIDRGRARRGRQVRRAESAPMNRSARSRKAAVCGDGQPARSSRGGRGAARGAEAASASSGPPTTTTRQPSSRNRAIRAFQWPGGQRLAAVPAPRWTASSGAGAPNRPAWSQSASSQPGPSARAPTARVPRATAARPAAGDAGRRPRGRARPRRRARPRGAGGRPATRSRSVDVDATRAGPSAGDPEAFEQGQPRADLVPAGDPVGDVGQQEPAAPHRPADPPRDARQGQDEHGQDVAPDVDAQVVARARGATGRAPRPPRRSAQRPRSPLEPGPLGQADAVDVRVGLEDLAVARRGEHVDRAPRDRRRGAGRSSGLVRTASPRWSSWTTRIRRGRLDRPGRPDQPPERASATEPDGVERADRDPPPHLL